MTRNVVVFFGRQREDKPNKKRRVFKLMFGIGTGFMFGISSEASGLEGGIMERPDPTLGKLGMEGLAVLGGGRDVAGGVGLDAKDGLLLDVAVGSLSGRLFRSS